MDIYKPKRKELKKNQKLKKRNTKTRPKGAVFINKSTQKETLFLRLRKSVSDILTELERVSGFLNKNILMTLIISVFIYAGFYMLEVVKADMPIQKVNVKGDFRQLDKTVLEEALSPLVGTNYFDLNVQTMKSNLMQYAWVQSVQVRKIWPDQVNVDVLENKAIAKWGDNALVNSNGKIFRPDFINRDFLRELPDLNGQDKQSDLVLRTYVELSESSNKSGLTIDEFSLVANNYWRLRFNNDIELYLAKNSEKESLNTFLKAYEKELKFNGKYMKRVDMRYSNGFSVSFSTLKKSHDVSTAMEDKADLSNTKVKKDHG